MLVLPPQIIQSTTAFEKKASVQSATIASQYKFIQTAGYAAAGDGGGARYKRASSEPTHAGKVQDSGGSWWELFDEQITPQMFGATGDGTTDDTTAWQNAIDLKRPIIVTEPTDSFVVSVLTIPANHPGIRGVSRVTNQVKIKHKTGATGALLKWDGTNRVIGFRLSGIYFEGNGETGETCGLDLSGFSYSHFEELYIRLFQEDGIYVDGAITPTNKQFSNNSFINVRSNNNERDGIRLDSSAEAGNENSGNTFVGCETGGNAGRGINELWGDANQWLGHISQGNTGRDFYGNGFRGIYQGYVEGSAKSVELGADAIGYDIRARSSFPLWNTFTDAGVHNRLSVLGEVEPERHIFANPWMARWVTSAPEGVTLNGSPTLASYTDTGSPFGAGLQVTVGTDFQGLIFSLLDSGANLQGKWVTLILEMDTSGLVDTLTTRVYARDGVTLNSTTGEFATETLAESAASGQFITRAYDVKFAATVSGTPTVIWYIGYSGNDAGGNVVKLRRAHIVMGQTRNCSPFEGDVDKPIATSNAVLAGAAQGINIHRKFQGKQVYDSTNGKLRFALNTATTSAWRATDGSGDTTPS